MYYHLILYHNGTFYTQQRYFFHMRVCDNLLCTQCCLHSRIPTTTKSSSMGRLCTAKNVSVASRPEASMIDSGPALLNVIACEWVYHVRRQRKHWKYKKKGESKEIVSWQVFEKKHYKKNIQNNIKSMTTNNHVIVYGHYERPRRRLGGTGAC